MRYLISVGWKHFAEHLRLATDAFRLPAFVIEDMWHRDTSCQLHSCVQIKNQYGRSEYDRRTREQALKYADDE